MEADGLNQVVVNVTPSRDLGQLFGNVMHREQSFGEIRGLNRLSSILQSRKRELEHKLNPKKHDQDVSPEAYNE